MEYDFDLMLKELKETHETPKTALVAGADDDHVLEAVFEAQKKGIARPVLIGVKEKVQECLKKSGFEQMEYELVGIAEGSNPSEKAVELIHANMGDFIIKGKMETKALLKPILNKETGLNQNGFITHFGYMQLKSYHKFLAMSDAAVIPYPTLEQKIEIIRVCVDALHKLGKERPIIGALCAVETVSDKMPETQDAARLQEMAENGEFGNAVVVGPISYDLATSKESAKIKGYESVYAGDVDMLLVPNMVTGNVMSKIWNQDDENILAGCLAGADIPIVLTSRSASMKEKLNSILLCAKLSG